MRFTQVDFSFSFGYPEWHTPKFESLAGAKLNSMEKDNKTYLEAKAKKALKKAKELEKQNQSKGKKYVQINPKTRVLR